MTTQERFAQHYGMPLEAVAHLVTLAKGAGQANEKHCNGDPHPNSSDSTDKNQNAERWAANVEARTASMTRIVRPYGFAVVYTGLYPALKRGDQFVEIPY